MRLACAASRTSIGSTQSLRSICRMRCSALIGSANTARSMRVCARELHEIVDVAELGEALDRRRRARVAAIVEHAEQFDLRGVGLGEIADAARAPDRRRRPPRRASGTARRAASRSTTRASAKREIASALKPTRNQAPSQKREITLSSLAKNTSAISAAKMTVQAPLMRNNWLIGRRNAGTL